MLRVLSPWLLRLGPRYRLERALAISAPRRLSFAHFLTLSSREESEASSDALGAESRLLGLGASCTFRQDSTCVNGRTANSTRARDSSCRTVLSDVQGCGRVPLLNPPARNRTSNQGRGYVAVGLSRWLVLISTSHRPSCLCVTTCVAS